MRKCSILVVHRQDGERLDLFVEPDPVAAIGLGQPHTFSKVGGNGRVDFPRHRDKPVLGTGAGAVTGVVAMLGPSVHSAGGKVARGHGQHRLNH